MGGLPTLLKHCEAPVFAPRSALGALWSAAGADVRLHELVPGRPLPLGDLSVTAFRTPHDVPESVGYRFEGSAALGFCTDLGHVTEEVRRSLAGCDAVVLEANHDEEMLRYGPYPVYLKRRILSDRGHLSNDACGELAAHLAGGGTRRFLLGHLSRENNRPELAFETVRCALDKKGFGDAELGVAPPAELFHLEIAYESNCLFRPGLITKRKKHAAYHAPLRGKDERKILYRSSGGIRKAPQAILYIGDHRTAGERQFGKGGGCAGCPVSPPARSQSLFAWRAGLCPAKDWRR